ncbi:MAG TPA: dGTPase, partial [Legionellales bacterium]|nr:dGTPase [Legionellales bacterium]
MWTDRLSGLNRQRGLNDFREPYERDRTRVIHSAAFRRLQQKTQIYGAHVGHFHRTRMTHSLEVASIGMSLARHLHHIIESPHIRENLPKDDLIYVICLLHDMGHPPFGHGGEAALNALMCQHGGFESNAQTLRLVTQLETAYAPFGLDLTRRTLLGILKYPISRGSLHLDTHTPLINKTDRALWDPRKAYYDQDSHIVSWILEELCQEDADEFQKIMPNKKTHHSFDCSIMDIADDIAYAVHDLEDAIHLRLISRNCFESQEFIDILKDIPEFKVDDLVQGLFSFDSAIKKQMIGALVHYFITSVVVDELKEFQAPLLKYQACLNDKAHRLLKFLIREVFNQVIGSPPARAQEFGGQNVLINLYHAIYANPQRLLDTQSRTRLLSIQKPGDLERIVCDCIANLTDDSA